MLNSAWDLPFMALSSRIKEFLGGKMSKYSLSDCDTFAQVKGGQCLALVYTSTNAKMEWKCKSGHTWFANFANVKRGTWCPVCSKRSKLSLEDCHIAAQMKEGICLSDRYVNISTKLNWMCKAGHTWLATFNDIKNNDSWCAKCANNKKRTIEECKALAISKEGKCLSEKYVNSKTPVIWECKYGHIWEANFNNVSHGNSWCPLCSNRVPLGLEECIRISTEREGKCLSVVYTNSTKPLTWECRYGHTWEANLNNVKNGTWCPICSRHFKYTIDDCKKDATDRNGACLSEIYFDVSTVMEWLCDKGHIWKCAYTNIKHDNLWCPKCNGVTVITIDDCKKLGTDREGECLSTKYKSYDNHLLWKCKDGHEWEATFGNIRKGSWCPICSSGRSEKLARDILEKISGGKFPKQRPRWLNGLELDGYNNDLQIGFEYQGIQHVEYIPHFHRTKDSFIMQIERDRLKMELCKNMNVNVIYIPHIYNFRNETKMKEFIELKYVMLCQNVEIIFV
jgi:hypothetical protein